MLRLSDHFLLLDFLYDQSTLDCVAHCGDLLADKIASIAEDSDVFVEGKFFCKEVLESIVENHGPVSIAAGMWFKELPGQRGAHESPSPHQWNRKSGAAADIVVHSWVNDGKSPKYFLETLPGKNIEYHRAIHYKGSEFFCVASRRCGNDGTLSGSGRKTDWRREPYTHSQGWNLKHNMGYERRLREAESSWTGDTAEGIGSHLAGSVVYGRKPPKGLPPLDHSIVEVPEDAFDDHPADGRKLVRPWHVRVSKNFVLLDFCRNERMFERRLVTVPPLTLRTANSVIKVARMFGEILDPVKEHLGNISVVRGMEPEGFVGDKRMHNHRWIPGPGRIHSVEFVTPLDPRPGYRQLLRKEDCNVDVRPDSVYGGDRVRVDIRDFIPGCCYTSATGEEYAWTS